MAIVIIPNKDFNFTYMQEIINCYCAKRGRINEKTEDGKKGIVPNFKKSQREARKCKMAYKIELDKIKVMSSVKPFKSKNRYKIDLDASNSNLKRLCWRFSSDSLICKKIWGFIGWKVQ